MSTQRSTGSWEAWRRSSERRAASWKDRSLYQGLSQSQRSLSLTIMLRSASKASTKAPSEPSAGAERGGLGEQIEHVDGGRCRGGAADLSSELIPVHVKDFLLPLAGQLIVAVAAIDLIRWAAGKRVARASECSVPANCSPQVGRCCVSAPKGASIRRVASRWSPPQASGGTGSWNHGASALRGVGLRVQPDIHWRGTHHAGQRLGHLRVSSLGQKMPRPARAY